MWALPEAALRRSSVDSFSSLNPASSAVGEGGPAPPVRKNNNNLSGNDPSLTSKPVSRQGSERMMTLNRRQLLSQIATSRKPSRITGESVTPVANVRFRERQEDNQKNELGSPITDEEHLFLLKVYLYPELRQQLAQERNNQRKLHFAEGSNSRRGSQNNNYLTHSRRPEGTLGRSAKGTKKKEESAENYLSLKQGGYQPPDPMILSMRNSTKTRPATKKATPKMATTQKAMMNSSIGSTGSAQTPSQYNNNNKFSSTA
ncbi:hypothetical protein AGDE_14452 [Angomonas deanei]|nr:hypothetical protein AGDE_14452 [Angomonas deanei]|eukprot:EPY20841.1 hypothetical protein AGDE_14452 [Angomonas deanei]